MINGTVSGNIGGEIKLHHTQGGMAILSFSVASNDRQKVDGEWGDVTTWVRVSMFGKQGESLRPHLNKGTKVVVGGAISQRAYTTQAGEARTSLDMKAHTFDFGSRKGEGSQGGGNQGASSGGGGGGPVGASDDFGPDDIPFSAFDERLA